MGLYITALLLRLFCEVQGLVACGLVMSLMVVCPARWLWSLRLKSRRELVKLAGYAVLGPITGPLAALALGQARRGRPVLAAAWALAIPLAWAGVASAATVLVHAVGR